MELKEAIARRFGETVLEEEEEQEEGSEKKNNNKKKTRVHEALTVGLLQLRHAQPGRIVCTFRVPDHLVNSSGILEAVVLVSLIDNVSAAALYSLDLELRVSLDINVTYMSSVKVGDEIEIDARVLKYGPIIGFTSVDIKDKGTGEPIAQGRASGNCCLGM